METWFWVLGWFLSILTMVGNGFVIFLVCRKRQLRTRTNANIVSLAVADFGVGMVLVPQYFLCQMVIACISDNKAELLMFYVRVFFTYASGTNLFCLLLERYIAAVKPLKYLTLMKRSRVMQMVLTSWGIPFLVTLTVLSIRINLNDHFLTINGYLYFFSAVIACVTFTFCLASMFLVVYEQNSRDRTLSKQLQFNQRVTEIKTHNTSAVSAVKWVALVTCVFLVCQGLFLRCSLLYLTGHSCDDFYYIVPLQVINSGINPIAYAFFKRDIKQQFKRFLFKSVVDLPQSSSYARKT